MTGRSPLSQSTTFPPSAAPEIMIDDGYTIRPCGPPVASKMYCPMRSIPHATNTTIYCHRFCRTVNPHLSMYAPLFFRLGAGQSFVVPSLMWARYDMVSRYRHNLAGSPMWESRRSGGVISRDALSRDSLRSADRPNSVCATSSGKTTLCELSQFPVEVVKSRIF